MSQGQSCRRARCASTEPHSCECGELYFRQHGKLPAWMLQRSRTRVSAESHRPVLNTQGRKCASTEPHSCECGEIQTGDANSCQRSASTEPHSCECGECGFGVCSTLPTAASTEPHSCECGEPPATAGSLRDLSSELQRSRTRVSAERPAKHRARNAAALPLQRSRTRVSAESCQRPRAAAAPFLLQRSRTRVSAESQCRGALFGASRRASTEPHSCECGESSR